MSNEPKKEELIKDFKVEDLEIGDFIGYEEKLEYFTSYITKVRCGCILDKSRTPGCFNVMKQLGGDIWFAVKPKYIISKKTFENGFYIAKENEKALLKKLEDLPEHTREFISTKINERRQQTIKESNEYVSKNMQETNNVFSRETFYIAWYVIRVVRNTLSWIDFDGESEFVRKFVPENIPFIRKMQFFGNDNHELFLYFIEEQVLLFKHKLGLIDDKQLKSGLFPVLIKKLESKLEFRTISRYHYPEKQYLIVQFEIEGKFYTIQKRLKDLLHTKIIIPSEWHKRPVTFSKCPKTMVWKKSWIPGTTPIRGMKEIRTTRQSYGDNVHNCTSFSLYDPGFLGYVEFHYHEPFLMFYDVKFFIC